ncbi:ABC transporter permease [Flavobacteriaceae bacterium]|nr:ABC transporter permease [Flavobacteriaceae bacterium]MDA9026632.1 ABC transporter permease [Flavobacteriaceae bacterium]
MKFPLYIAKRYLFSKSTNSAINIITLVAGFGVVIATAALFIVLSGFSGLKNFSLEFTSFSDPDLKIVPTTTKTIQFTAAQKQALIALTSVDLYSEVVEERMLMSCENKHLAVTLKGVDTNYPNATIDSILVYGQWFDSEGAQIVAGWGVTTELGFGIFDVSKVIKLYAPKPGTGQISSVKGAFTSLKVANAGIFQINETLDNSQVFTSIENAKYLLNYQPETASAIEVYLAPSVDESTVRADIQSIFNKQVTIKNRIQLNDALYKMLNTEHVAVYLIFTLILIIALFNIIGSIIMMILDKKKNLKTLYNLGTTVKELRAIFFYQGILMTAIGGSLGLLIGVITVWLQQQFSILMITTSLAYPVDLQWINLGIVLATILVLGAVASRIASQRISKIQLNA